MRLEYQVVDSQAGFKHRLVDIDDPRHDKQDWVGYRTPAIWEVPDDEGVVFAQYIRVSPYYQGSREFPDASLLYYVCGMKYYSPEQFEPSQNEMARRIWLMVENYLTSIPDFEDPTKPMDVTARLEDFHRRMGEQLKRDAYNTFRPKADL